jgi:hypothetical protein
MSLARFPALTLGMVSSIVQAVSGLFLALSPHQTALINALVVAVLGVVTAWLVKGDALVAALVGVGQAMLALLIGFGLNLPTDLQASIMAFVAAAAAAYVHTQVVAPVPAEPGSSPLEPTVVVPPPPT